MAGVTERAQPRLLIAEDNPELRAALKRRLGREGFEVAVAGSFLEAQEMLGDSSFDVLLLDLELGDGFGLDLLHDHDVPTVVHSGSITPEVRSQASSYPQVVAWLPKGSPDGDLALGIRDAARRRTSHPDQERIQILQGYELLDSPPEAFFDAATTLAASIAETPIALVSLVDESRQWFKAHHGLALQETPRSWSFCNVAVAAGAAVFVVDDAQQDPRFQDNPLVTGEPFIRFYAGFPLRSPEGAGLGTLCVIDDRPRSLTADQRTRLLYLAAQVQVAFELRRSALFLEKKKHHLSRENRALAERAAARTHELAATERRLQEALAQLEQMKLALDSSQRQFLRAQRLEGLGRLASGVAHDFNNLITVIRTFADLTIDNAVDSPEQVVADMQVIRDATDRAADLVEQLMAFGRREVSKLATVNINVVIEQVLVMLERLIGEDVQLVMDLEPDLACVVVDVGQLEQVIVNLAVNARDAMPQGGTLILRTRSMLRDEAAWVMLEVEDDGIGMSVEVQKRVFEPFFTTKGPRQGTGLGLSTVYGIVSQSEGTLELESSPGEGTTFRVLLPPTTANVEAPIPPRRATDSPPPAPESKRPALVLLIEDDRDLLRATRRVLEHEGFAVVCATSGEDALELLAQGTQPDVLVTDLVLSGMNGASVSERARQRLPDLPCLFMSGYAEDAIAERGLVLQGGDAFLSKPFHRSQLVRSLRDLLLV